MDTNKIFYKRQVLCDTLTGNPCYLLTITSETCSNGRLTCLRMVGGLSALSTLANFLPQVFCDKGNCSCIKMANAMLKTRSPMRQK